MATAVAGSNRSDFPTYKPGSLTILVRQLQQSKVLHDGLFENVGHGALARDILFNGRNCAADKAEIGHFTEWATFHGRDNCEVFGQLLGRVLGQWDVSSLEHSGHHFGNAGAKMIAHALKDGLQLRELRLIQCVIGSAGVREIAKALTGNRSLQTLVLDSNLVDHESVPELLAMLDNCALTHLSLQNNQISPRNQHLLCEAWRQAGKLQWPVPALECNAPVLDQDRVSNALCEAECWSTPAPTGREDISTWQGPLEVPEFEDTLKHSLGAFVATGKLPADHGDIIRLAIVVSKFLPEARNWLHDAMESEGKTQLEMELLTDVPYRQKVVEGLGEWLAHSPPLRCLSIETFLLSAAEAAFLAAGLQRNDKLTALHIKQLNILKKCPGHATLFAPIFQTNRRLKVLDIDCAQQFTPNSDASQRPWPYDEDRAAVQTIEDGLKRNRQHSPIEAALSMQTTGLPNEVSDQILDFMRWISLGKQDEQAWQQ